MKPSKIRLPYQTKGLTYGKNGMVATANKAATIEALRIMMEGGNAFDGALVAATVTTVTMPACCQLGGDAFAVVYSAKDRKFWAMNGSGVGQNLTVDMMREQGYKKMPVGGPLAVALPGSPDVYDKMLKFCKMPLSRILEPAIRYARDGFLIGAVECQYIKMGEWKVMNDPDAKAIFAKNGEIPHPGEILYQKDLANSYEQILRAGSFREFYEGELGDAVVEDLIRKGAKFDREQFRNHQTEMVEPMRTGYRGYDLLLTPPPSQGMILAQEMKILEGFDMASYGQNSTRSIHTMVEAKKFSFASRMSWAGDPRVVDIPWDKIMSDEAIEHFRKSINPNRAMTKEEFQDLLPEHEGDTTSFVVADKEGNAISFIHSLSNTMGSGVVAKGTGITLNNRGGRGFVLIKGHPNSLAPNKRTMHTLLTWILARNGKPVWIGNTPGGDNQPQWGMQVISNLVDYGFNEEQAVSAPRWYNYPGTDPEHADNPFVLVMEEGMPETAYSELARMGHDVDIIGRYEGKGAQEVIKLCDDGILIGGTDPRTDGDVLGF